jgi:uncharacterized protein YndB with AHSA1/START domain/DNA-binding transcriptional ArsR family regulator
MVIYAAFVDDHLAFRALADPTRRLLLDRLFERDGRTLSDLERQLPDMTRFGVMKHLKVLEEADLVTTRKVGRRKLHYLNPVPIQLAYDRWVSKYTRRRSEALADLKAVLETGGKAMQNETATKPRQVYEVFIKAEPERVWEGITRPEFTARYFYDSHVRSSLEPGSPFEYLFADGQVGVDGEVLEAVPPRRLVHTWRSLYDPRLAADAPSRVTWEIEPTEGGVCKLTVVHDGFETENATFQEVAGGWSLVLSGLKTLLETGEPMLRPSQGAPAS